MNNVLSKLTEEEREIVEQALRDAWKDGYQTGGRDSKEEFVAC